MTDKKTSIQPPIDISFLPGGLKLNDSGTHWYFGNQRSTYEVITSMKKDDEWVETTYDIVKNDPGKYGTYAGNNDWSPYYTNQQLINLYNLVK